MDAQGKPFELLASDLGHAGRLALSSTDHPAVPGLRAH
jgi:hypothetical protein